MREIDAGNDPVEETKSSLEIKELKSTFPGLIVAGEAAYPEVPTTVYHAYSGRDEFNQDDFYDGSRSGVRNQIFGPGLYTGSLNLASKYEQRLLREDPHGRASIEALDIAGARLLDMSSGDTREPLNQQVIQELNDHIEAEIVLADHHMGSTKYDREQLRYMSTLFSSQLDQYKSSGDDTVFSSLRQLVGTISRQPSISGCIINYLVDKGIDGIAAEIQPSVDNNWHNIFVFWGGERVASQDMYERRQEKRARFAKFLGSLSLAESVQIDMLPVTETKQNVPETELLKKPRSLSESKAKELARKCNEGKIELEPTETEMLLKKLGQPHVDPFDAVKTFAGMHKDINRLMSAGVGVWEGYALHEHTQAVLGRFEAFADINGKGLSGEDAAKKMMSMRLALLLQDIGKPIAVSLEGKSHQHQYNRLVGEALLKQMPLDADLQSLITDLISQDYIGEALQGKSNSDTAAEDISKLHQKHKKLAPKKDSMFQMLYILHQVDASAYTSKASYKDSEGKKRICLPSFDNRVFRVSENTRRVKHTPKYQKTIKQIVKSLNKTRSSD